MKRIIERKDHYNGIIQSQINANSYYSQTFVLNGVESKVIKRAAYDDKISSLIRVKFIRLC